MRRVRREAGDRGSSQSPLRHRASYVSRHLRAGYPAPAHTPRSVVTMRDVERYVIRGGRAVPAPSSRRN
jgi:hypothetical protein